VHALGLGHRPIVAPRTMGSASFIGGSVERARSA
jgi:hypothetical protein